MQQAVNSSTMKRLLPTSKPTYQTWLKGWAQGERSVVRAYAKTFEPERGTIAEHELICARSEMERANMNEATEERLGELRP